MNAGITFAREQRLSPGLRLSDEHIARLTSDIVWLETQTRTLPEGGTVEVWVPQVYLAVKPGDLDGYGGLISADKLVMNHAGGIANRGTLAGRRIVDVSAADIKNSGVIQGGQVRLKGKTIGIEGGTVAADTLLSVEADRIKAASSAVTRGDGGNGQTQTDRVAGLYVTNASNGLLNLQARHSLDLEAADLRNEAAGGHTRIASDGRIRIGTLRLESHGKQGGLSDKNHRRVIRTAETGSTVSAKGGITVAAADKLDIRQSHIHSDGGQVLLSGQNVSVTESRKTLDLDESVYGSSSKPLSRKSRLDQYRSIHDEAAGSEIGGKEVLIAADKDILIRGGNVVSDRHTLLRAGGNIDIAAAQSTYHDNEFRQTQKSGLMGTGGIGFTIGSKKDAVETGSRTLVNNASAVGSLKGGTVISAGQNYRQTGSTVSSPEGGALIRARNIDIEAAQDTYATDHTRTIRQKGLTVAVNVPAVQAAQGAAAAAKTPGKSKSARTNAMAAANAAWQTRQLLAGESHPANLKGLADTASALSDGDLKSAADASNVSVSITYGQQKNVENTRTEGTAAQGSRVIGGGRVGLSADEGRLNITGSDVAGKSGTLLRAKDITLQSAAQTHRERSSNRSSGWNAGLAVSYGQNGFAFGITAGGNYGKGAGSGDSLTHRHSHIGDAESRTLVQSGGDTQIKGAQVYGSGIDLSANRLSIESVQNTAAYQSRQQNLGGQVTVGYGASGSASYSRSKMNADHASVTEQSGLFAGSSGFNVNVQNHTDLKGGIITATEKAESEGKNRFQTGSLSSSDIQNRSEYQAQSFGIGTDSSALGGWDGKQKGGISNALGYGRDKESQHSETRSGIATQNILIRSDKTGEQTKAIQTGIRTETAEAHSGKLDNSFDKERVQKEINLQRNVSLDFNKSVQSANGEINKHLDKLKSQLHNGEISQAEYDKQIQNWQRGSVTLNMIASGLSAPTQSAAGIAAATASPAISYQIGQYFKSLSENNQGQLSTGQESAHIIAHAVLGAAVAAAGGNDALSGALGAGGTEAVAPIVSQWLYGQKKGSELTSEQKETVASILSLASAGVGAVAGDGSAAAVQTGIASRTAVENNFSLSDFGISQNSQHNLQQAANQQVQQFVINANSSAADKAKLLDLLEAYKANAAITAEITAALGIGANIGVSINQNKSIVITVSGTAGYGVEGFVGLSTSNISRNDGFFSEICSSVGGGVVTGGCVGAHLERNEPLIFTGKMGTGAAAIGNANIGYQWTIDPAKSNK